MKKVYIVLAGLIVAGCTPTTVEFMEKHSDSAQHEKALKMLDPNYGNGTVVLKRTESELKCMKDKMNARGYYLIQDDIDCTGK